jgi:hypothetical protein
MSRTIEQPRFVLQRGPDAPVEPCTCGSPFGILRMRDEQASLACAECSAPLNAALVQFHDLDPERRSPSHAACGQRRIVVPRVRDEVGREWTAKNGAERWDLFCVACGEKDGMVSKAVLLGGRFTKRRDDNAVQRIEVLERAGRRCDLCRACDVPLHVGHCLSVKDADAIGVPRAERESLWNKCALCEPCNVANLGGYGEKSMSPSTYCDLTHTRTEARKMLDIGREVVDPEFYRIYCLLRQRLAGRRKEAA